MKRVWEMWEEEGVVLTWPHKPRHAPLVGGPGAIVAEQPERTVKGKGRKRFRLTLSEFAVHTEDSVEDVENRCGEILVITQVTVVAREKGSVNVRLGGMDMVRAKVEKGVEVWTWKGFYTKSRAWWGPDNLLLIAKAEEVESITLSGDVA